MESKVNEAQSREDKAPDEAELEVKPDVKKPTAKPGVFYLSFSCQAGAVTCRAYSPSPEWTWAVTNNVLQELQKVKYPAAQNSDIYTR